MSEKVKRSQRNRRPTTRGEFDYGAKEDNETNTKTAPGGPPSVTAPSGPPPASKPISPPTWFPGTGRSLSTGRILKKNKPESADSGSSPSPKKAKTGNSTEKSNESHKTSENIAEILHGMAPNYNPVIRPSSPSDLSIPGPTRPPPSRQPPIPPHRCSQHGPLYPVKKMTHSGAPKSRTTNVAPPRPVPILPNANGSTPNTPKAPGAPQPPQDPRSGPEPSTETVRKIDSLLAGKKMVPRVTGTGIRTAPAVSEKPPQEQNPSAPRAQPQAADSSSDFQRNIEVKPDLFGAQGTPNLSVSDSFSSARSHSRDSSIVQIDGGQGNQPPLIHSIKTEPLSPTTNPSKGVIESLLDIQVQPRKLVFNAPYIYSQKNLLLIKNQSDHRYIAFRVYFGNNNRISADYMNGIIRPLETFHNMVLCKAFEFDEQTNEPHKFVISWINVPQGEYEYNDDWFEGDGMAGRKTIQVEYSC